jgi:CheY-like chemotaxis protein
LTPGALEGVHVLVAEDNRVNALLIRSLLARHGIQARLASTGAEACTLTAADFHGLIFMDVQMPEMDGIEAARRIREREAGGPQRSYIVALTAEVMAGDREKCLAAGMDDYLSKPLRPRDLLAALQRFVNHTEP